MCTPWVQPLHEGDTIAIVAPSSALAGTDIQPELQYLTDLGYQVKIGRSVTAQWGYLAGSDELRASDIQEAFENDQIQGILCLRGGYGAARLLPLLNYDRIARHRKLFIGFSDITALHVVLQQRAGLVTIHGPMLTGLKRATDYTREQFAAGLRCPFPAGKLLMPRRYHLETLVPGTVSGPLTGGNMMLIASLIGTPYALDGRGSILFLEEVGEDAYAIDRMLCQFEQSGLISQIKGLAFGEFTRCCPAQKTDDGEWTVREIITQYARRWGKPAVWGLPCGHNRHNGWLPLGCRVQLQLTASQAEMIWPDSETKADNL